MDLETILKAVSEAFKIPASAIMGKSRKRKLVLARDIFFELAKINTELSYEDIGGHVGRDHATVSHGADRLTRDLMFDYDNANELLRISNNKLMHLPIKIDYLTYNYSNL